MFRQGRLLTLATVCLLWPAAARLDAADVRQFGATGDGLADDTAAIQKAVDSGAGEIRFSKGRYRITRPVVIRLDEVGYTSVVADGTAQIVMAGPGPALRFLGTHEGTASPATVKDNVWANQRAPMVTGIEIVGDHPEAVGLEADGTMQWTVTRVIVRKALHGIHLVGRNRNVIISDCHLYENRGVGIYLDDVNLHQINVTGSHISYNLGGGIVSRQGNVRNLHVGSCDIEANHPPADAPPEAATANILLDCRESTAGIGEVAITGCTIQHTRHSPNSANIRMLGASGAETREGHVTITGNVLSDAQVNIELRDVRGAALTGNTCWGGIAYTLIVDGCRDVALAGNVFDRNPRYRFEVEGGRDGVLLRNSADCTVSGVQVSGVRGQPAGIVLEGCQRVNLVGCSVVDCEGAGILLVDCTMCRVSDSIVDDTRDAHGRSVAVRIVGGKNNMVVDNLVTGSIQADPGAAVVRGTVVAD